MLLLIGLGALPLGANGKVVPKSPLGGQKLRFTHLSAKDGLSSSLVRCVLQDRQGFMWFGTVDGLNRYDGLEFRVYRPEAQDERSLSHAHVRVLYEDRRGTLWVGTERGLDRYDRETDRFDHFRHDPHDGESLPDDGVLSLLEDKAGTLWVGTRAGLGRLDLKTGKFRAYACGPEEPRGQGGVYILDIAEDTDTGFLWLGTGRPGGVSVLDPATGRVTRYRHDVADPASLGAVELVSQAYRDRAGTWWFVSPSGLDRLDPAKGTFSHFLHSPNDAASLSDNNVTGVHEDGAGRFWVATRAGLDLLDRRTGTFSHVRHDHEDPESLGEDGTNVIYEDGTGALWFVTLSQGVDRLSGEPDKFVSYRTNPRDPESVSEDIVTALYADRAASLWAGTLRQGLNHFDGKSFRHLRHDPKDPRSLSHDQVMTIGGDVHGTLWVATVDGVLSRYDGKGFVRYLQDPDTPGHLGGAGGAITFLHPGEPGGLWIGLGPWGIDYFDGKAFTHFRPDAARPPCVPDRHVVEPAQDQRGSLWLAGEDHGLVRFDPHTGAFTCHLLDPEHPQSAINRSIQAIHADWSGALWVGNSTGLVRFDPASDRYTRHYSRQDGLPADGVVGILEDGHGDLWLSTAAGLSRFSPKTGTFRNFDEADGLPSRQFLDHSSATAPDGQMFFGSLGGVVAFYPDRLQDDPHRPPVVLTSFELFNAPVTAGEGRPLRRPIEVADCVTLRHDQSVFTFKFAALNYSAPRKNRYAYKLEGFDDAWRATGAERRFATYTNLDPGRYLFRVRASNNDGVWNETGREISVVVIPPWWRTGWFRGFAAVSALGLALGAYSWRVRSLRERTVELELQVAERTRELLAAKDVAERAQRAAEVANRAKSSFLANMSHELRTPLNAILGYADILKRRAEPSGVVLDGLTVIQQSGDHLLTLINDVLDLAKIEAGKIELRPAPFHLPTLLRQVTGIIRARAEAKDLFLTLGALTRLPAGVSGDERRIRQVLLNLLGNAVKFTDRGRVALTVEAIGEGGREAEASDVGGSEAGSGEVTLRFTVEDTGLGMAPDQLERIFLPFEQVSHPDRRSEGAGLGLAISQQIVQAMGSHLEVRSVPRNGSTFWFDLLLPVTEPAGPERRALSGDITGYEGPRRKVLVADDVLYNRLLLVDTLTPLGFEVSTAADGQRAVEEALEQRPDVILMDLVLPVKTGLEAIAEIRRRLCREDVTIVAVSASVLEADEEKSRLAGCDAFLPKPIRIDGLLALFESRLHLTWIHAERPGEVASGSSGLPLVPPPADVLEELLVLAQTGRVLDIQERVTRLARIDDAYVPFSETLQELAKGFEMSRIETLVGQLLKEGRGGHG